MQVIDYRYLGIVLNEFLDFPVTARVVAGALGLLISKDKIQGGMPYKVFTKLYNALVQCIIDYGVAIWGYKEFSSINAVQNRACRYFLGVGKYTPTAAVQGDMGWYVPLHKQFLGVARFWCRMYNMNNTRLNKQIFTWSRNKSSLKCKNAIFHIQLTVF